MDIFNKEKYKLIDINCYYGYWPDRTKPVIKIEQINDYLQKGFSHICLTSARALFLDSYSGNNEIHRFAGDNSNILPVIVLPHHLEKLYDANIFAERWLKIFRSISIQNIKGHRWLDYIAEIEGIIIVPYTMGSDSTLFSVAKRYKRIKFVLTSVNYPQTPEVLPLLKSLENIYLEISCFQLCSGLEYLFDKINPEKILFGSNYPIYTPESVLLKLNKADLDYKYKKMIGRDNILRLLGGSLL